MSAPAETGMAGRPAESKGGLVRPETVVGGHGISRYGAHGDASQSARHWAGRSTASGVTDWSLDDGATVRVRHPNVHCDRIGPSPGRPNALLMEAPRRGTACAPEPAHPCCLPALGD